MSYLFKRLMWMLLAFWTVTILVFWLLKLSPRDPVEVQLELMGAGQAQSSEYDKNYEELYHQMEMHLPDFYFSISPSYYPVSYNRIYSLKERDIFRALLKERIDAPLIAEYIAFRNTLQAKPSSILPLLPNELMSSPLDESDKTSLSQSISNMQASKSKFHFPVFRWHGFQNQYHHWLKNFMKGDFGQSSVDGLAVKVKICRALGWTTLSLFLNLILTLLLAIPLAILNQYLPTRYFRNFSENVLMGMYAVPVFWIGTMVVVFLSNDYYGIKVFELRFPSNSTNVLSMISYVLPLVICMTLAELAYFYFLLSSGMDRERAKPYILTAISKGLNKWQVLSRHVFPNSLIAPITLIFASLPLAISGALILEVIFNVPGMGRLMYDSLLKTDYQVVYGIVAFIGLVTIAFSLLADVLYTVLNPAVSLSNKNE